MLSSERSTRLIVACMAMPMLWAGFLAQQAGFALEEDVPLEVVVEDAVLKLPLTSEAVKEFQELLNDTMRLEYELAETREMRRDLLPEIGRIEREPGKAEWIDPPIEPEDMEKLPAEDRVVLMRFIQLFEGEQRKKAALKEEKTRYKTALESFNDDVRGMVQQAEVERLEMLAEIARQVRLRKRQAAELHRFQDGLARVLRDLPGNGNRRQEQPDGFKHSMIATLPVHRGCPLW